jgi:hypothetical protein
LNSGWRSPNEAFATGARAAAIHSRDSGQFGRARLRRCMVVLSVVSVRASSFKSPDSAEARNRIKGQGSSGRRAAA